MKRIYMVILLTIIVSTGFSQNWIIQNSITSEKLNSVFFTDTITGFAVGNSGTILKTINGSDWEIQGSETDSDLNSVFFATNFVGYAVGNDGVILKTTDGGNYWENLNYESDKWLRSVHFVSVDTGFVAGTGDMILKTTDGGETWIELAAPASGPIWPINSESLVLVGDNTYIFSSSNSGLNWDVFGDGFYGSLNGIHFLDSNKGMIAGGTFAQGYNYSEIYYTNNGGSSWSLWIQDGNWLNSVFLMSQNIAYSVGDNGEVFKTIDGGVNWNSQISGTSESLNSICFTDSGIGYIVGDAGIILKTKIEEVNIDELNHDQPSIHIYPNPIGIDSYLSIVGGDLIEFSIISTNGQLVKSGEFDKQGSFSIDIDNLISGLYILQLKTDNRLFSRKLVVK